MYFEPDPGHSVAHHQDPTDKTIWRYVTVEKYLDLITRKALFFTRLAHTGDPFEGSYPRLNITARDGRYPDKTEEEKRYLAGQLQDLARKSRSWIMINCWHASDVESAAMWDLYAARGGSVALKSCITKLRAVLPKDYVRIADVAYIDYATESFNDIFLESAAMHKRKSFEHEREVRAFISDLASIHGNEYLSKGIMPKDGGRYIAVDPATLIEEVRIAPFTQSWTRELVEHLTRREGFGYPIVQSDMEAEPLF